MIVNMLVDLSASTFSTENENSLLQSAGVALEHRHGITEEDAAWIRITFGGSWHEEAAAGWNWLARLSDGELAGFCTFEQREFRWWWLAHWLERPDVGIFGPMGIDPALRGRQIGWVLARRGLASMKSLGLTRAVIPAAGPLEFYKRCCGAVVAERLGRPT